MKKIVSAALVASMIAGAAFADVKISTNYRLGTNLLTINPAEADGAKDVQGFNDITKAEWADDTKISASGENAGIVYVLKTAEGTLSMNYGYAWLGWGNFKLYGGTRDARGFINRVNPLDGNWWNNYCEYGKPGVHKKLSGGLDASNLTVDQSGSKAVNFTADYSISDTMNVAAAFFKNATSESVADKLNVAAQFNMKAEAFTLNVTGKFNHNGATDADDDVLSLGAFANLNVVDGLNLLLGATLYRNEANTDKENIFGFDVRASYKADALTLSTLNNISLWDGDLYTWHTLGAAYKVSDVITAVGAQLILSSEGKAWGDADAAGNKVEFLAVRPYIDLTAQKGAVLSIGAELKFVNIMAASGEDVDFQFTVPMVMRVKL